MSVRLAGAVVLVSGASRGIGRAVGELLAGRGAVVVWAGRDEAALASLAASFGGSTVVADLREPGAAARIVAEAVAAHGRLDAVVVNAGVGHAAAVLDTPDERIGELVDVNVRAAFQLAAAGARAMTGAGGAVVFVSSIAGAVGVPAESVYSATKAAVEAFAVLLREELRQAGITVSTVLPGVVDTDFFTTRGLAYERRFPRKMPAERVARAVVRALETGTPRRIVPRWLAVPARLSAVAPGLYRALARRFG